MNSESLKSAGHDWAVLFLKEMMRQFPPQRLELPNLIATLKGLSRAELIHQLQVISKEKADLEHVRVEEKQKLEAQLQLAFSRHEEEKKNLEAEKKELEADKKELEGEKRRFEEKVGVVEKEKQAVQLENDKLKQQLKMEQEEALRLKSAALSSPKPPSIAFPDAPKRYSHSSIY